MDHVLDREHRITVKDVGHTNMYLAFVKGEAKTAHVGNVGLGKFNGVESSKPIDCLYLKLSMFSSDVSDPDGFSLGGDWIVVQEDRVQKDYAELKEADVQGESSDQDSISIEDSLTLESVTDAGNKFLRNIYYGRDDILSPNYSLLGNISTVVVTAELKDGSKTEEYYNRLSKLLEMTWIQSPADGKPVSTVDVADNYIEYIDTVKDVANGTLPSKSALVSMFGGGEPALSVEKKMFEGLSRSLKLLKITGEIPVLSVSLARHSFFHGELCPVYLNLDFSAEILVEQFLNSVTMLLAPSKAGRIYLIKGKKDNSSKIASPSAFWLNHYEGYFVPVFIHSVCEKNDPALKLLETLFNAKGKVVPSSFLKADPYLSEQENVVRWDFVGFDSDKGSLVKNVAKLKKVSVETPKLSQGTEGEISETEDFTTVTSRRRR